MASSKLPNLGSYLHQLQKSGRLELSAVTTARSLQESLRQGTQIPSLSANDASFDKSSAYEVSAAFATRRFSRRKHSPIGRKIGFTNQKIWSEYNVNEPIWGYLWREHTYELSSIGRAGFTQKAMQLQPRIEPEIIFGLSKTPNSSMTDKEALQCVEWVAHGFEIVVSLFKDWKFSVADTIAMNALHRALYIGSKLYTKDKDIDALLFQLENFTVDLHVNDRLVETGAGSNVLGSPIKALLHLCKMLEDQTLHPQLMPGETVATGTLTQAMPIVPQDRWWTKLHGIDLNPIKLKIFHQAVRIDREPIGPSDSPIRYISPNVESTEQA